MERPVPRSRNRSGSTRKRLSWTRDYGPRTKDGLRHQVLRTKDGSYTETKLL